MFLNTIEKKKSIILIGIVWAVLFYFIPALGFKYYYTVLNPSVSITTKFIFSRVIFWLWLLAVYLYTIRKEKQRFLLWQENHYSVRFYISSVLVTLLIIFIEAFIIAFATKHIGLNEYSKAVQEIKNLTKPVKLVGVVTAAFVEELIFRGYLIPRSYLFFKNIHLPIIISAILFSLGHVGYGTLINILGPFFIGLVFAYHYYKYRNIKILIVCHFVIDYLALILRH